jgi:farnesyl diphosphate synthase
MPDPTIKPDIATSVLSSSDAVRRKSEARRKFEGVWESIRSELLTHFQGQNMPIEAREWYDRNLNYNVPGGKLNRGMSVVDSVEIFRGRILNDNEYFQAAILGWCIELLQAFFLVADDIMDQSITRRGQKCWYKNNGVGNIAINDAIMLEASIYHLLKLHFRKESYYVDLLELFHEITHLTEMGQLVDLITAPEDEVDLNKFSLEKHRFIVIYKTAYYSFYLPVALAMYMTHIPSTYTLGHSTLDPYKLALDILLPLGEYFQIQDDFLDYSGTPEQIGKIGTDIVDNKCSWCINTALAIASPAQRKILDDNYGQKDPAKEAKIKVVFKEVGIPAKYRKYEEDAYQRIMGMIEQIPDVKVTPTYDHEPAVLQRQVFKTFLDKIYRRTK